MKLYLPIALIMCCLTGRAQQYFYTLNQYAPLLYNPAVTAKDNDASISFLNRRTEIAPGLNYQNNAVNGKYPFINSKNGKRYGGIGLSFLEKNTGNTDMLKTLELTLSMASALVGVLHQQAR